jgi:hypothetical protein
MDPKETKNGERAGRHGADDALSLLIAAGESATKAADRLKMSLSTVKRRMATPEFRAKVEAVRKEVLDRGIGILAEGFVDGAITLRQIARSSTNELAKLSAAKTLVEAGLQQAQIADIAERLTELETKRSNNEGKKGT